MMKESGVISAEERVWGNSQKGWPANVLTRTMALLIDVLLLACLTAGGYLFFVGLIFLAPPEDFQGIYHLVGGAAAFLLLLPILLAAVYFMVLHSFGGQTLGKIFMGIQVVPEKGQSLTLGASFLRLVGYLVSAAPLGAGFLWAVLDKKQAAWHDKLSLTRVVYC